MNLEYSFETVVRQRNHESDEEVRYLVITLRVYDQDCNGGEWQTSTRIPLKELKEELDATSKT